MNDMGRVVAMVGLVLGLCLLSNTGVAQTPDKKQVMKEILAAWKKRQDAVKTLRMSYQTKEFVERGYEYSGRSSHPAFINKPALPKEDTKWEAKHELVLSGRQARFEMWDKMMSLGPDAYIPMYQLSVATKKKFYHFSDPQDLKITYPQGVISWDVYITRRDCPLSWLVSENIFPAGSCYKLPGKLANMVATGRTVRIGKANCIELSRTSYQGVYLEQLWVDPKKDYLPIRYLELKASQIVHKEDIEYKENEGSYKVSGWKIVRCSHESPNKHRFTEATVTQIRINEPVEESAFPDTFPPGTAVSDDTAGLQYVIKKDGSKRIVLPDEVKAGYEKVMQTETGEALPEGMQPPAQIAYSRYVLAGLGGLALCVITGYLLIRLRRWRMQISPGRTPI